MSTWNQILFGGSEPRYRDYALCAEEDNRVLCRKLPKTAKIEERFLWSYIGGALVNKVTGKVLEASADLNKPLSLRNASTPLRPTQTWKIHPNTTLSSRNGRMITAIDGSQPGCLNVIGTQVNSEKHPGWFISWRFCSAPLDSISSVDIQLSRSAVGPMQKMAPPIIPESPNPMPPPSQSIPGDDKIGPKELLFEIEFWKEQIRKERGVSDENIDDRKIEDEWDLNGIQNGRRGSPAFDVKFYLERNEQLRQRIAPGNYKAAVDYFLSHVEEPVQTSESFNWTVYRQHAEFRLLTPKQLFYHFNRFGYRQGIKAISW